MANPRCRRWWLVLSCRRTVEVVECTTVRSSPHHSCSTLAAVLLSVTNRDGVKEGWGGRGGGVGGGRVAGGGGQQHKEEHEDKEH